MNRTSKIWTIISHEYTTKVRSKGFIIATALGPIAMFALILIPGLIMYLTADATNRKIAVVDNAAGLGAKIVAADTSLYFLSAEPEKSLHEQALSDEIDGYMVVPSDFIESAKVRVFTGGGGGLGFITKLENVASEVWRHEYLKSKGADPKLFEVIDRRVDVQTEKVTEKGSETDYTAAYAGVGYALGFIIYILTLLYGTQVMRGAIEEKANRIVEIIASSARPFEIMMGKVVGIGAVGLTQVLIWTAFGSALFAIAPSIINSMSGSMHPQMAMNAGAAAGAAQGMPAAFQMPSFPLGLVALFIFFFIGGYFLYASLFAAIGSAVDQESDAQQLMWPVTLPIIIPILFISAVINDPDSTLSVVLSLIPLFTPIIMIVRVAATDVPIWQVLLSIALLIGAFLGAIWLAAKVYRVGILMYGKKPSIGDIIKWIRIS
ncbi:MAG: ABC transporter permease [Chloroflexota bacterium]